MSHGVGREVGNDALESFPALPDEAHVKGPTVRALYGGISQATLWRWLREGKIPQPRRFSKRTVAWNVGALRRALAEAA